MTPTPLQRIFPSVAAMVATATILLAVAASPRANALTLLPVSRHSHSLTYALFSEEQSAVYRLAASSTWIAIGGSLTVAEFENTRYKPQITLVGVAKAWMEISRDKAILLPQTIDAHAGITVDLELSADDRIATGWYHLSGHAADEVRDKSLLAGNVGTETLFVRYVRDVHFETAPPMLRVGATLKPVIGSDPKILAFGAEQFIEVFPWGRSPDPRTGAPYTAFGIEELGVSEINTILHVQLGYAFGSHFVGNGEHTGALRGVLGYYSGFDPRLKLFEMRNARLSFAYAGLAFNF